MTAVMRGSRGPAVLLAGSLFVADQVTKLIMLHMVDLAAGPVRVLPVLDFVLVWNRGISYGLFQQSGAGRWILVALTIAATVALTVWMLRTERQRTRLALAAVVGGALGNLVDRIAYGAVVDFVHIHWGTWSWYVFNVADAAIVVGVAVLVLDGLFTRPSPAAANE